MATRATRIFNILMAAILIALPFVFGFNGIDRLNDLLVAAGIIAVSVASGIVPEVRLPNGMKFATKGANVLLGFWLVASPFIIENIPGMHYSTAALASGLFVAVMVITTSAVPAEVFDRSLPHVDHRQQVEAPVESKSAAA